MPLTVNIRNWWLKLKLLLDQNLSPSLIVRLQDLFPDSVHVQNIHLDRAPDYLVFEYAGDHGFSIVTQDADFADRIMLEDFPPKIIWLRAGNRTTDEIETLLRKHAGKINEFEKNPEAGVLVIR